MSKDRVTIQTYRNRKGDPRLTVLMSRGRAIRIATGDQEALQEVAEAITKRIEREETQQDDS